MGLDFTLPGSFDLDLDPMTLIYKLDLKMRKMYLYTKNELSVSQGLQTLEHYRQTDTLTGATERITKCR